MQTPIESGLSWLTNRLLQQQAPDGSWRFCFESGISSDAYMIIMLRSLQMDDEALIKLLHGRIASEQHTDGTWRAYPDERAGNVSATVEGYFALLYSGYSLETDPGMQEAKQFIARRGGIGAVDNLLTKLMLAVAGQYPWPDRVPIPLEFLLLPDSLPVHFNDFVGYVRVHLVPALLLADRKYVVRGKTAPELSALLTQPGERSQYRPRGIFHEIEQAFKQLAGLPQKLHQQAVKRSEQWMLERLEPDGTLYGFATSTILMIFALLAIGYDKRHSVIANAVQGLRTLICNTGGHAHLQNSTSTVWDTSLISYALQQAGLPSSHPAIRKAGGYLLERQQTKLGDWSRRARNSLGRGWGFPDINTLNPDVDDTTAALRALDRLRDRDDRSKEAVNRGLQWIMSMQNDDGGWSAFERNTDNPLFKLLPVPYPEELAGDPSSADLTGRTLEYLGNTAGFTVKQAFVRRAVEWLLNAQEKDGSWYGRWGICYIYGAWSALTGMLAVGQSRNDPAVEKAAAWLTGIQNPDGGWGESCESDRLKRYVPLDYSTSSQTAWALDALVACHDKPTRAMERAAHFLLQAIHRGDRSSQYPTGAGLPGQFYFRYHSYPYIWPLLALSHYQTKYRPNG